MSDSEPRQIATSGILGDTGGRKGKSGYYYLRKEETIFAETTDSRVRKKTILR